MCNVPDMPTLDDVMASLSRIELRLNQQGATLQRLVNGENLMASQLDTLIQALNDNTNAVSARIDKLISELGDVVTPAQLAELQAVSDHLKTLGQDPQNPVPPAP